ncbi:unnamed protein product [Anisakis simplex]|uniref:Serine/threonine-protein kinase mTOR (inferred by orthology to a human protein) n=1 Tax=Anisakis simplex TaxID=6269 RepID=A0A0M3KE50_ANISI|nr:unnamed protein product [Anisakis simplex]
MLSPFVRVFEVVDRKQRADVLNLIQGVLRQLVSVAVVDSLGLWVVEVKDFVWSGSKSVVGLSAVEVRLSVLRCFKNADHALLSHLAQADMLELIFMSLHDEKLEIQEEAVALLGKLGDLNPAFVLPRMRKILLETLSQLTNSRVGRLEEYSARLIAQIAHLSPKFMRPYMNPVLSALIPKLRSEIVHVDVTIQVLNAISELAISGGADLVRTIDTLFTPLLQFLQDSSSLSRREAALRTLGRLCQNTAYVVDPYRDYPELLEILLRLLKTEMSVSMRRTTMRVGYTPVYLFRYYCCYFHYCYNYF